ncbi:hypothetical protein [Nocardia carnea]|uniref:hypothetical protein n=1 Tax=Nocardia carnea TaxID=37328 RepID=UPI0024572CB4|nr:hypothetical protein [Nocardia carnea]
MWASTARLDYVGRDIRITGTSPGVTDIAMLTGTGYADLIAIVEEGRLLAAGTMEELADPTPGHRLSGEVFGQTSRHEVQRRSSAVSS